MLLTLLLACNPENIAADRGLKMSDYFPQDGERAATFKNESADIEAQLYAEKEHISTTVDGVDVWTWDYYRKTDEQLDLLYKVQWAAPTGDGVWIYGYVDVAAAGDENAAPVAYDTPILIAPLTDYMKAGDSFDTETNGETWNSTLVEVLPTCEIYWGSITWTECAHFSITSSTDAGSDALFAGDYWQATTYGTAWFVPSGDSNKWIVLDYAFTADGA